MSADGRELRIGRMGRTGEDRAEATCRFRTLVHIELQLVEPLLVEGQHAVAAMDLETDEVVATAGGTARQQRSGNTGFEAHDGMSDIFVLDRPQLCCTWN